MTQNEAIEIITNAIQNDNLTRERDTALSILQKAIAKENVTKYVAICYAIHEPKKRVCKHCNKEFSTYGDSKFCSKECEKQYRIENATCTFCHRNLLSLGIEYYSQTGGARFCSEECKKSWYEYLRIHDRYPSNERTCPQCNQAFKGKNTIFCSKKCYEEAKANGWKPDSQKKIEVTCQHCNKTYTTPLMNPSKYCPDCVKLSYKIRKKKYEAAKKKQAEEKRRADIEKNGLCFYCQTTYFNCEKMRSNFRYYPKGAVVKQGEGNGMSFLHR